MFNGLTSIEEPIIKKNRSLHIIMIDLNSEEKHDALYKDWKGSFEHKVRELLDDDKEVIFVAISVEFLAR